MWGRERMLVALGRFSRPPTDRIKGHTQAPARLALARRMRRKHGLTVVFIPVFDMSLILRAQTRTKPLRNRFIARILAQHRLRRRASSSRCWRHDLDATRNVRIVASCTAIALQKPLVCRRWLRAAAAGDEEEGGSAVTPPRLWGANSGDPKQLDC